VSARALPLHAPPLTGAGAKEDIAALRTVVRTATGLLGTTSLAVVAYALLTGDRPHRTVLLVAATTALTHHERYDGAGHPDGVRGEEIPLAGPEIGAPDHADAEAVAVAVAATR
jgi:HD domain